MLAKVIEFREIQKMSEVPDEKEADTHGPFRPYERLVSIKILGKTFDVPEKNSLLRCFQFISPETIPTAASAGIRIASIAASNANCPTTTKLAK